MIHPSCSCTTRPYRTSSKVLHITQMSLDHCDLSVTERARLRRVLLPSEAGNALLNWHAPYSCLARAAHPENSYEIHNPQ